MVLFREDEQRIKEMERRERLAKRTRLGSAFRLSLRIFLVMGCVFAFGLWLLAMLGGNNDALKKGIEDYLTQVTGLRARVNRFEGMTFFPDLGVDMGGISFSSGDQSLAFVSSVRFRAGFFDMMFSRRRFEDIDISSFEIKSGLVTPEDIAFERVAFVSATDQRGSGLIARGSYGGKPLIAQAAISHERRNNSDFFILPPRADFDIAVSVKNKAHARDIDTLLKTMLPAKDYESIRVIVCDTEIAQADAFLCQELAEKNPAP